MSPEKREVENTIPIQINWAQSKEVIADFTREAFILETGRNKVFAEGTSRTGREIYGLLYNLGHPGRTLEGFEHISLKVPKPKRIKQERGIPPDLVTSMPIPNLYLQLITQIESYFEEARNNPSEDKNGAFSTFYPEKINALKIFAECSSGKSAAITFAPDLQIHKIKKIQVPYVPED